MTEPQSNIDEIISEFTLIDTKSDHSKITELSLSVLRRTGSLFLYLTSSGVARKALFSGVMYLAGGSIISTVGLGPVIVTGAIIGIL